MSADSGANPPLSNPTPELHSMAGEESLRTIIEAMAEGLLVADGNGRLLYYNSAALQMLGVSEAQLLRKEPLDPDWQMLFEDGRPMSYHDRPAAQALRSGKPVEDHVSQVIRPDGTTTWLAAYAEPIYADGEQQPYAVVVTIRDVTARRETSARLATSEAMYRKIVETAQEGVWVLNAEGVTTFANARMASMLGYEPEDLLGRSHLEFIDPSMRTEAKNDFDEHRQGHSGTLEVPYRHRDGHLVWLLIAANPLLDDQGNFSGALGMVTDITARRQMLEQLQASEVRFRAIFNTLHEALVIQELGQHRFLEANQRFCELYGYTPEEIPQLDVTAISANVPPYTVERAMEYGQRAQREGQITFEWRARRKDGTLFWVETTLIHMVLAGVEHMLVAVQDITERKRIAEELEASEYRYRTLADSAPVGIFRSDANGNTSYVNAKAAELTGLSKEQCCGMGWLSAVHAEDRERVQEHFRAAVREQQPFRVEQRLQHPDGRIIWVISAAVPEFDEQGLLTGHLGTITDITEQKRIEAEIRYRANYDPLTGLPNRDLATERLEQALKQARREQYKIGLLFVDLDHFKEVNDTRGHALGDRLLQEAAQRLRDCVRDTDTVARQGGDEFVLLLNGIEYETDCAVVAEKIIETLSAPFELDGHEEHIGASIGITLYPNDGSDVVTLFRNADLAMYRAKDSGRNTFQFFKLEMTEAAMERRRLEVDLRSSLVREELRLHYQPIVDLRSGQVVAAEALLRWQHPTRGLVPPDVFIPVAEELGLIRDIGNWVLTEGCRQLLRWRQQGFEARLAINVSVRQIPEGLSIDFLRAILDHYGIEPQSLVLEITESVLMADLPKTHRWLEAVRDLGVEFSLDDFGTGYSSLSYLKRFPISYIKIDKEFVRDMNSNPADRALIEAILAMAAALDLLVVAEGIETGEQYQRLAAMGCEYAQGYYLARPVPEEELDATVTQLQALLAQS